MSVTASPETALKKLAKANIAVFNTKKRGSAFLFCVRDVNVKKVFAIFSHPCYNINVYNKSRKNSALAFAANRFGLFIGGAVFLAAVVLSDAFVFRIRVTGSGSYLSGEVLSIMRSEGVSAGSFYKGMDKPLVQARIMALPSVTFCSVSKQGSVIVIDVETDEENSSVADYKPLVSGVEGTVVSIVAICGTAEVAAGQKVERGTTLIGAYSAGNDGSTAGCLAVGYARIEVGAHIICAADEDSEENARAALASVFLYSDEITGRSYKVRTTAEGVAYEIDFTYIYTASINIE